MRNCLVLALAVLLTLETRPMEAQDRGPQPRSLVAFGSDEELGRYLRTLAEEREARIRGQTYQPAPAPDCGVIRVVRRGAPLPATDTRAALIRGTVADEAGSPVEGAVVAIDSLGIRATSSTDGAFVLAPARERLTSRRDWTLSVKRIGTLARQQSIRIGPRDSVDVHVTLCTQVIALQAVTVTGAMEGARAANPAFSITNVQHAGVDEGGIVKMHGDHLVILRRGRLFTVRIGGDDMEPISMVNAFGPGIDPQSAWYDELLVAENKVVVVGYSYRSRGTEIGVFRIGDDGELHYLATYHLRSNDYYSSRNYASRLMGTKLIFYTPHYLWFGRKDPLDQLPAMRKWNGREGTFKRIVASTRVFRPARELDPFDVALHTVTVCDLATQDLECEATGVLGPAGRVFYVSPSAVYTWVSTWRRQVPADSAAAMLYRMPLDGSVPKAVIVAGSPVDQFSFLESDDGHLNVLVRDNARGDGMWRAERTGGDVSLLRLPLASFGDGRSAAPQSAYRALPVPSGPVFVNRFVGDHLLYGTGNSWRRPRQTASVLHVIPWKGGDGTAIFLRHGTDRIEVMGSDAVVIGTDGRDLHLSGVRLDERPALVLRYVMPNAAQGELRSHGFFYKPDGADSGILGLPIRAGRSPGYQHLFKSSASILFLRNADRRFRELGTLEADGTMPAADGCVASCVDWYGNARPLFVRGRILALLGYELVEGRLEGDRIRELQRTSFAPPLIRAVER